MGNPPTARREGLPTWTHAGLVRLGTMDLASGGGAALPVLDPRDAGPAPLLGHHVVVVPFDPKNPPPESWVPSPPPSASARRVRA